jgi:hypothetical protein
MHSLALGVRHAGIIARNATTPWSPSGLLQGGRRHIGTENVTMIFFDGPFSPSAYVHTRWWVLIHFLVFWRI